MKQPDWLFVLAALVSASGCLVFAVWCGVVGFPLDDAWIHQVYARNLATLGEFAFFPGQPSAGSTSPLWTILLSLGYLLQLDFRVWAYWLGILLLGLSGIMVMRLVHRLADISGLALRPQITFLVALFLVFEWHLAWSAASGMEILLFVFLSLLLVVLLYAGARAWVLGVIAGALVLTRPEGILLAVMIGLGLMWQRIALLKHEDHKLKTLALVGIRFGIGLGIMLVPYVLFNFNTSDTFLPNTFYAKNAEYAVLFDRAPFIQRWGELLITPFVGAQILLIPGLIYISALLVLRRQWLALIPVMWILMLPALYAWRLPVTYQHGRYEMPVIPFIAGYGIWGTSELFKRLRHWAVRTTWALSTGVLVFVFWALGVAQYATDVTIVHCEMVGTAKWVAANAPADAMVAAHDIGALGYFYPRPFIDLAGLVTPEVIPFIRNESRLRDYVFSRQATFVIVFPDWYPTFDADPRFVPAHQTNCAATRAAGEKNMIVYRIVNSR